MEYTYKEKQVLDLIKRTDFKNLSKNDFLSYASKLNELRPEVASQVIAQYPELANLIKATLTEYKGMLDSIISSDDSSVNQVYGILNKEMDNAATSRETHMGDPRMRQSMFHHLRLRPGFTISRMSFVRGTSSRAFDTMVSMSPRPKTASSSERPSSA